MAGEKDIVCLSLPLTAGVAVGVLIPASPSVALICAAALGAVMAFCIFMQKRTVAPYSLLYFATGLFIGASGSLLPPSEGFSPAEDARIWLSARIESLGFESPVTANMAKALALGMKDGLGRDVVALFRESGTSHILALSGLHLGIFYLCLSKLLWPFGRGPAGSVVKSVLIMLAAIFYVLIAGGSASLSRALIFIILREISRLLHRDVPLVRIFFSALMIQLILRPSEILAPGFQLSYMAVAGIVLLFPEMKAWYPDDGLRGDPLRYLWQAASLTISCQLFTSPVAWAHFGTFPSNFLLANILALPLSTVITALSMAITLLAAAGCCPQFMLQAADSLTFLLLDILRFIA